MARARITTPERPKINTGRGTQGAAAAADTSPIMRRGSTHRYQTFPTQPPETPTDRPSSPDNHSIDSLPSSSASSENLDEETPLPLRQLLLLAFLSLCEQTALNSIAPYLPEMVGSMPGIPENKSGVYIGLLGSAFALAQLSTNLLWGYASDIIGRKPVLLAGTFSLMMCFCVFGLCTQYWQMVVVHALMGLLNGNAACVPTVLGEITDRSNQSRAFTYLPIIYSIGGISGPALGGALVRTILPNQFPYFAPNIVGAGVLAAGVFVIFWWFEETLDETEVGPAKPAWVQRIAAWSRKTPDSSRRNSWSARWPQRNSIGSSQALLSDSSSGSDDDGDETTPTANPFTARKREENEAPTWRKLLNRTTTMLLATYLVFQLSNISFNSLYPIYAAGAPPTGRGLKPSMIGLGLAVAGVATIVFQAFVFHPIQVQVGSMGMYRLALLGIAVCMVLMPWVGHLDDKPLFGVGSGALWLYIELGVLLIIKNVCAVGGLSSVMLLVSLSCHSSCLHIVTNRIQITNAAPSHSSLGTLNGIAQTLSALGRSVGPFLSGGIFTLSMGVRPKGEALAWCLFGGMAALGWAGSFFIHADKLESDQWQAGHASEEDIEGA